MELEIEMRKRQIASLRSVRKTTTSPLSVVSGISQWGCAIGARLAVMGSLKI